MIPASYAPAGMVMFHPAGYDTPDMILHGSHIFIYKSFWTFRYLQAAFLVREQSLFIRRKIPEQGLCFFYLCIIGKTVLIDGQIFKHFFNLFFFKQFHHIAYCFFMRKIFPDAFVSVKWVKLEYCSLISDLFYPGCSIPI